MITKPKGEALSFHRGVWNVVYYRDNVRKTQSLSTDNIEIATFRRDLFFQDAQEKPRKVIQNDNKYVYRQLPFYVKIDKKLVGRYKTKKEAIKARDEYLALNS